ncbi:MAG: hypothetical protein M0033_12420, partial [Nitrospiraceae bacterium]|nr:hypothetical protein [Nitrospiraceae bacterium]
KTLCRNSELSNKCCIIGGPLRLRFQEQGISPFSNFKKIDITNQQRNPKRAPFPNPLPLGERVSLKTSYESSSCGEVGGTGKNKL